MPSMEMSNSAYGKGLKLNVVIGLSFVSLVVAHCFCDGVSNREVPETLKCDEGDYNYKPITKDEMQRIEFNINGNLLFTFLIGIRTLYPFFAPNAPQFSTRSTARILVTRFVLVCFFTGHYEIVTFERNWHMIRWYMQIHGSCHNEPDFLLRSVLSNISRTFCVYFFIFCTFFEVYYGRKFAKLHPVPNARNAFRRLASNPNFRLRQPGIQESRLETPPPSYSEALFMLNSDSDEGPAETIELVESRDAEVSGCDERGTEGTMKPAVVSTQKKQANASENTPGGAHLDSETSCSSDVGNLENGRMHTMTGSTDSSNPLNSVTGSLNPPSGTVGNVSTTSNDHTAISMDFLNNIDDNLNEINFAGSGGNQQLPARLSFFL